jgi:hypothetical protein
MAAVLDTLLPTPDVRERHWIVVRAPAELVFQVARRFDLQTVPLVHAIFWLRARMMRAGVAGRPRLARLDSASLLQMGWTVLVEEPGRLFIAGAACQPWRANVVFTPVAPDEFADYAAPDVVKIAWTLETQPLGAGSTRLATETRAVGTDAGARAKFRRYWRWARVGIIAIRWLLLPAIRREAERLEQGARGSRSLRRGQHGSS